MSFEEPATLAEFFERLEAGIFPPTIPELPMDWVAFRRECEDRERAGRDSFGNAYKGRDNRAEAQEECSDLAMYAWLDHLQYVETEQEPDEDFALVLTAAHHGYKAHQAFRELAAKRNGSP